MRVGLAQMNSCLGDFSGNREKILDFTTQALSQNCDLVVFPEMTLMGYLPNDLLERSSVVDEQLREFKKLLKQIPSGISILVGLVTKSNHGKPYFNSAALLTRGAPPKFFHKQLLPTYDVFDEARHHERGDLSKNLFRFCGKKVLLTICEDIWGWPLPDQATNYLVNPLQALQAKLKKSVSEKGAKSKRRGQVDLVINMSASPFTFEKAKERRAVVSKTAALFKAPMIYVNMVGGQDEIIYDGGSFAVNPAGRLVAQSPSFEENLNVFDLGTQKASLAKLETNKVVKTKNALVLGIRDFAKKAGLTKIHLGLSGGIDSAVVACLATEALGPDCVVGFTLPGPHSEAKSKKLGEALARNLGLRCFDLPIQKSYELLLQTFKEAAGDFEFGLVNENLQARLRGIFLMAYANKENSLLLTTGNKSEYATGYSTLYGDMCGGLAPIADLLKCEVYELANLYNEANEVIPAEIISRPPSAELREGQKDQDSLPPYDDLDASVRRLVERAQSAKTETDKWLLPRLLSTEFKRWQAPPILKVSRHAFGRGRRFPIAHKARK